jgi:hypothetical protein
MPSTSPIARRRQRSVRITVASALLIWAAGLVAAALAAGLALLISLAAAAAVLLGAVATRITYSEVVESRREVCRVQAEQAQAFTALTEQRVAENADFVAAMAAQREFARNALLQMEEAVGAAQFHAADAERRLRDEVQRADAEGVAFAKCLDDAEIRAAEGSLRVAELEQERDVLRAELDVLHCELASWGAHNARGVAESA